MTPMQNDNQTKIKAALYSAGAVVGLAAMASAGVSPVDESLLMVKYALEAIPYADASALFNASADGARDAVSGAAHAAASWLGSSGVEISRHVRSILAEMGVSIGQTIEGAQELFLQNADVMGERFAALRDMIRNSSSSCGRTLWDHAKSAFDLLTYAAEAWGAYTAFKEVRERFFSKAKSDLTGNAPEMDEKSINLSINISVGGEPVLTAAEEMSNDPRLKNLSQADRDQIVWMSEAFAQGVADSVRKTDPNSLIPLTGNDILIDPPASSLSRAALPLVHWDQSSVSQERLEKIKASRSRLDLGHEDILSLADPLKPSKDAKPENTQFLM